MATSFLQSILALLIGIIVIILLTAKYRIHAFFALLLASFIVGFGVHLSFSSIFNAIREGFGHIMQSLGLIIVLGVTLGVLLEHSGCTRTMANFIIKKTGEKRAALAMSITGFIVGLPVFCDSAYIVLNGLNQSISKRTGASLAITSVSLATGAYSVHCLIPPHPGAAAAAATLGVGFGKLILTGAAVAIPGMIVAHIWARYAGQKLPKVPAEKEHIDHPHARVPVWLAFLPVLVPILLIAGNSFFTVEKNNNGYLQKIFSVLGEPAIALATGALLVLTTIGKWKKQDVSRLLQESAEKAGGILVIIGAGGAFGSVLAASGMGNQFSAAISLRSLGIFFPFLLTFILKTAQGSSTVAIITASSIIFPLLPALGLNSENGALISVLSMGAGSMMISHANDAYFWVISKFSGLDMKTMLKSYSIATVWMGMVTLLVVYILSLWIM